MDFLNQAIAQIGDLFRSMTPGARITAGLLLAVVVVSFGYLFQQQTAAPDEFLFGGVFLPDGQLNQIEAAIAQAGLSGHRREGNRIRVPSGQKAAYLAAVADAGAIPPNFHTFLENAINVGGPWESTAAMRERLKIANQQMLSEIIRAMDWVEDAVVIYDEQRPLGLSRERQVTGSVSVKPIPGEVVDPRRAANIQRLVAYAVVGLRPEDVAVTNLGGSGGIGPDGDVFADAFKNEYYQTLVNFEQYKKASILNALRDIPGVRVEVKAELDDTVLETTQDLKPDAKTATRREVAIIETSEQGLDEDGGQVGVVAQGPGRQASAEALAVERGSKSSTEKTETDNFFVGQQRTWERQGFTPKEVWATVTIPRSYLESVWKQQNPDATEPPKPDDLTVVETKVRTNVEDIVEPLLPRQNKGEDSYKQVKVVFLDLVPPPPIAPPSIASTAMSMVASHWNTLVMLGVTVFSLLVLRSMVRAAPTAPGPAGAAAVAAPTLSVNIEEEPSDEAEPGAPPRKKLKIKKGTSLKDDLVEMVHEDPDAAAEILRTWIGKAA